ncbi:MAG: T9SS type A sorting domain-containing protein [Saprospiraceae bacterium]|nr:T9SS type A sorting domain-containing protein [Saprospiraceae bacterium]
MNRCWLLLWGFYLLFLGCHTDNRPDQKTFPSGSHETNSKGEPDSKPGEKQSGAGLSLEAWYQARFSDQAEIPYNTLWSEYNKGKHHSRTPDKAKWKSIGPKNIGGRTLCLAFHPTEPDVIYAGSASGGLWRTNSSGIGYKGWVQIPIDLPVYSIASILISPKNPDILFIGTGEVYNKAASIPSIGDRTSRGTYGIGILKSRDGGKSWTQSLAITNSIVTGVQDLEFDPYDDQILYAATTNGLYKSTNQGSSWTLIHPVAMAVDVDLNPKNPEIIFVTHGSYLDNDVSGIYRSNNSGSSFIKLKNGLPESYSGKAKVTISKSNSDVMYASIANAFKSIGLFMSLDAGSSWDLINDKDVADIQGWYSHDVAVHSTEPNVLANVGQNAYFSDNNGLNYTNVSSWDAGDMGRIPVGGPEGIDIYVHADMHAVYFHPLRPEEIYIATDGGIFVTKDRGQTFEGRNGGYITAQFYSNFSASKTNTQFAIGGMQDNGTAIYDGQDGWIKVIGGDGLSTAIHPQNENIIYGSYQYFGLNRSMDKGKTWEPVLPSSISFISEPKAFNTPFEIIPTAPGSLYAGAQKLYINENNGHPGNWRATHANALDPNAAIITIAAAASDPAVIYLSTLPLNKNTVPKVFRSLDKGATFTHLSQLPVKSAMDIAIDPLNANIVYIVFSGFGIGSHLLKSMDGGQTWHVKENGLPNVPTNCIAINPNKREEIYLGNDLGVFYSSNAGERWEKYMDGLPNVVMAMSLSISPKTETLKLATHGNGVYESQMPLSLASKDNANPAFKRFYINPNPTAGDFHAFIDLDKPGGFEVSIHDLKGQFIYQSKPISTPAGTSSLAINISPYPSGTYFIRVQGKLNHGQSPFSQTLKLVKY